MCDLVWICIRMRVETKAAKVESYGLEGRSCQAAGLGQDPLQSTSKGGAPEQKSASRRSQPEQDFEASLQGHRRQAWWRHRLFARRSPHLSIGVYRKVRSGATIVLTTM